MRTESTLCLLTCVCLSGSARLLLCIQGEALNLSSSRGGTSLLQQVCWSPYDDEWWVWHPIYSGMSRVFRLLSSMVGFEPTPQSQCLTKQAFLTIRPRRNLWMTHSLSIPSLHLPLAAAHITCVALNEKNSNLFYGNRHHLANQRTHVIFSSFIINHLIFVKELLHDLWLMTNIRHMKHISLWYIYWFGA